MRIFIVIDKENRLSAHTSATGAAKQANISARTLSRANYSYNKGGFRIECVELNRIKGRGKKGF